jgi:hypothetical protein
LRRIVADVNKELRRSLNINCDIDLSKSTFSTAVEILGNTYTSDYFSRVENLAFHDLTKGKVMPPATAELLGLGPNYIPAPKYSTSERDLSAGIKRLRRDMYLKAYFASGSLNEKDEWDEEAGSNRSKMYLPNPWTPSSAPSQVDSRLFKFVDEISKLFKSKRAIPNLRPHELKMLIDLSVDEMIVIALADKGLGPCAVTLKQYIKDALEHLCDKSTYDILTEAEAHLALEEISKEIDAWLSRFEPLSGNEKRGDRPGAGAISHNDTKYIRHKVKESWASDPYSYFYLLYKIHKQPLKTRPVVSTCGCVSFAIAQWVDIILQPMAKAQQSYFKDSRALKKLLIDLHLPHNASVFSFDAVAMYSNIDSNACLLVLTEYLRRDETRRKFNYNPDALIEAISIVLRSNVMKFGDIFVRQTSGVAMGINPAPPLATLFFALREDVVFNKWKHCIFFNKRFIDDGLAFWLHQNNIDEDERCWKEFQKDINNYYGLEWTFTKCGTSVEFMDMVIKIENNRIVTDLYEKSMNLYLYIPPASAHPPGLLPGLVIGQVIRIFSLCTYMKDVKRHIKNFHTRLMKRGYSQSVLLPLFKTAADKAAAFLRKSDDERTKEKLQRYEENQSRVFFHLKYHPNDPPSSAIQKVFRECILQPRGEVPFHEVRNDSGQRIPVERLTVCYSTHPNIGSILSYRKICGRKGLKVSSFLKTDT